jgi:hypothetical protein
MAGKKYVCNTGITDYDNKGTKYQFEAGDEYTGPSAKYHLEIGDPNTGPSISEVTDDDSDSATPAITAGDSAAKGK